MWRRSSLGVLVLIGSAGFSLQITADIGSDTAPSRQSLIIFSGNTNNTVLGFAALAGGFFLTDSSTSFSFSSYFPVGVTAGFNRGICYLLRDLPFDSYITVETSGTIDGNLHTVEFAPRSDIMRFPNAGQGVKFDQDSTGTTVYSVDWSTTDTYLLAGTALSATYSELQIFAVNTVSKILTPTAGLALSVGVNEVGWQPVSEPPYYFAAATTDGVRTYSFNNSALTITALDAKATGSIAMAVAWAPSGTYLAISSRSTPTVGSDIIGVYTVSPAGLMTVVTTTNSLPPQREVSRGAIAWNSGGNYLAVGTNYGGGNFGNVSRNATLFLYAYNGASLSLTASLTLTPTTGSPTQGTEVASLAWSHDGALLAVGLGSSAVGVTPTNKIRLYSFNGTTLTEQTGYRNGETQNVYNISWMQDDYGLAYVRAGGVSYQVRGCIVNRSIQRLTLWAQGALTASSTNGLGVAWNHLGSLLDPSTIYVASGDDAAYATLWGVAAAPFILNDVDLVFNGPVELTESIIFNGVCSVTSNHNFLNVNNQSIILNPGTFLTVYNTVLYGMGGGNSVIFRDDTSTIMLANAQIINTQDFYLHGPLMIEGDVHITGTFKFTYSTNSVSTIASSSRLCFDSGVTFSYNPPSNANNLIVFQDSTAELYLYEVSTYITCSNGLSLTKGTLTIDGLCPLYAPNGLFLGDGTTANNITLNVLPDSGLKINSGYLINKLTY